MNWEKACEVMDAFDKNLKDAKNNLRYLIENLEDLKGQQDTGKYAMEIQEEFLGFAKFQMSTINNVLNLLNKKAEELDNI
jgi:ATP:corrinoid adenosyltransferase